MFVPPHFTNQDNKAKVALVGNRFFLSKLSKMPPLPSSDTKAAIFAHRRNGLFDRKITAALLDMGMRASRSTVSRVINECEPMNQGIPEPLKRLGSQNQPSKRTKALIKKVALATKNATHLPRLHWLVNMEYLRPRFVGFW